MSRILKNILTVFAVFAMAVMLSSSTQSVRRSHTGGRFMMDIAGSQPGYLIPIDKKGNGTVKEIKPGAHTLWLLVPAAQKVREAADRGARVEVESWSWGVSRKSMRSDRWTNDKPITVPPKTFQFGGIIKHDGEEYYKIELENILVSSYQQSDGSSGGDKPSESLSLNFTKIEWDIKEKK